ncbi:uncharacterized protein LOC126908775 [Daktulosphaira vitifoliae]|uniref:uncharacterized protein LOC126908775 n=1 Tax=Daktulosphaira vitifoliae TaxID=58002 RepID=UPI0021A9E2A1|nr:uncharacterized protein LOC126908775 [Daktulosphaira vitifoliae]
MDVFRLLSFGIIYCVLSCTSSLGDSYDEYCNRILALFRSSKNMSLTTSMENQDFLQFTLVEYYNAQEKCKQAKEDVKLMEIEASYADQAMQTATMDVMVASTRLQTAQEDVSYSASMLHSARLQYIEYDQRLMDTKKKADILSAMMRSAKTDLTVAQQLTNKSYSRMPSKNALPKINDIE